MTAEDLDSLHEIALALTAMADRLAAMESRLLAMDSRITAVLASNRGSLR